MNTGIPVREWWDGDQRDLFTALEVLALEREQVDKSSRRRNPEGVVTSG